MSASGFLRGGCIRGNSRNSREARRSRSSVVRPPRSGFTLLELLAVIAIIAVLTGIVIGVGRRASEAGKVARAKAELAALSAALESYKRHYGDYPQIVSEASVASAAAAEQLYAALNGQRGPRLDSANNFFAAPQRTFFEAAKFTLRDPTATPTAPNALLDPWGRPYRYAYNTRTNGWQSPSFLLVCAGPDEKLTLPLPASGFINSTYEEALDAEQKPVNADNLYANRN